MNHIRQMDFSREYYLKKILHWYLNQWALNAQEKSKIVLFNQSRFLSKWLRKRDEYFKFRSLHFQLDSCKADKIRKTLEICFSSWRGKAGSFVAQGIPRGKKDITLIFKIWHNVISKIAVRLLIYIN